MEWLLYSREGTILLPGSGEEKIYGPYQNSNLRPSSTCKLPYQLRYKNTRYHQEAIKIGAALGGLG
jgi:hypothetical protein